MEEEESELVVGENNNTLSTHIDGSGENFDLEGAGFETMNTSAKVPTADLSSCGNDFIHFAEKFGADDSGLKKTDTIDGMTSVGGNNCKTIEVIDLSSPIKGVESNQGSPLSTDAPNAGNKMTLLNSEVFTRISQVNAGPLSLPQNFKFSSTSATMPNRIAMPEWHSDSTLGYSPVLSQALPATGPYSKTTCHVQSPSIPHPSSTQNLPVRLTHPSLPNAVSTVFSADAATQSAVAAQLVNMTPAQRVALIARGVLRLPAGATLGPSEHGEELKKMAVEDVEGKLSDEVFSGYKHNNILEGCKAHPGDIVEAGSLASIPLPKGSYGLATSLPNSIIVSGQLSSLQLEGILYACQRHQIILPNQTRAGFFIGDGAGVGKGRQISGLILDNFCRGRTRHVWFSTSTDLIIDAKRDLGDIGCYVKVIEGCRQLDKETRIFGLPADFKEGVIFSTYATLVSSVQKGTGTNATKHSRLQQLIDWCGGRNFDGCLIFDECHKAKNFNPGKESSSTKVALAVSQIQRLLPKARVVYCSATGVTDVKNMAFMERLGLWGDGAPFKSFDRFLESIHKRGLGVAEMLAMEMKATGMYVSRGLSFKQAEFLTIEANLTPEQIKTYDTAAHLWNEMRKALDNAVIRTKSTNTRVWSSFWGSHQRFFKQLCMGMKVPTIVQEAKEAIANGCCVVIGLQTTGEASLENERIQNDFRITGFVSLCREIFTRFIDVHFPTYIEGAGNTDESGLFVRVRDQWCSAAKTRLTEFAKMIELPKSPLDEIIDQLGGPEAVAEMTGRRARIVRRHPQDRPQYELRDADNSAGIDSLNVRERNMFMEGKKLVAIISDAASTGISLHADNRVKNQCRRVHLTIELPWSADKAVQQLGRSHRSNQSSGPLYKLVTTNLGGERRFASAVARRLLSLGALTKGDRRAATGQDLSQFNFDSPYGRTALRAMYHAICKKEMVQGVNLKKVAGDKLDFNEFCDYTRESLLLIGVVDQTCLVSGMSLSVKDKEAGDVGRFLNRILGLRVERQNLMFQYFCECLENAINSAKQEGRYNEGLLDITAASIQMVGEPKEVFKDAAVGDNITKHITLNVDRGMSWETAMIRYENHGKRDDGFYKSKREVFGRHLYLLATQKENSDHIFRIARPNTGLSGFDEDQEEIFSKYTLIDKEDAEKGWKAQYERTKERCMHGPHCKVGPSCNVGSRCYKMHLLSGCIVTLLNVLESTLAKYQHRFQFSQAEKNLRVVRVQLDNGERVVGIRFPEVLLPYAEEGLKEQKIIEIVQARQTSLSQPHLSQIYAQSQNEASKNLTAVIEKETDVIQKYKNRAITPPVTLKKFFSPVSRSASPATSDKSANEPKVTNIVKKKLNSDLGNHFKSVSRSESWDSFTKSNQSSQDSGNVVVVLDESCDGVDVKPIISSDGKVLSAGLGVDAKDSFRSGRSVSSFGQYRQPPQKKESKSCFNMFKPIAKEDMWKNDGAGESAFQKGAKDGNVVNNHVDKDLVPGASDSDDCCVIEVKTPSCGKKKETGKKRKAKPRKAPRSKKKGKRKSVDSSDDEVTEITNGEASSLGKGFDRDDDFQPESTAVVGSVRKDRPRRASAVKASWVVEDSEEEHWEDKCDNSSSVSEMLDDCDELNSNGAGNSDNHVVEETTVKGMLKDSATSGECLNICSVESVEDIVLGTVPTEVKRRGRPRKQAKALAKASCGNPAEQNVIKCGVEGADSKTSDSTVKLTKCGRGRPRKQLARVELKISKTVGHGKNVGKSNSDVGESGLNDVAVGHSTEGKNRKCSRVPQKDGEKLPIDVNRGASAVRARRGRRKTIGVKDFQDATVGNGEISIGPDLESSTADYEESLYQDTGTNRASVKKSEKLDRTARVNRIGEVKASVLEPSPDRMDTEPNHKTIGVKHVRKLALEQCDSDTDSIKTVLYPVSVESVNRDTLQMTKDCKYSEEDVGSSEVSSAGDKLDVHDAPDGFIDDPVKKSLRECMESITLVTGSPVRAVASIPGRYVHEHSGGNPVETGRKRRLSDDETEVHLVSKKCKLVCNSSSGSVVN